jgi:hypothetical protein
LNCSIATESVHARSEAIDFQFEPVLLIATIDGLPDMEYTELGYDAVLENSELSEEG